MSSPASESIIRVTLHEFLDRAHRRDEQLLRGSMLPMFRRLVLSAVITAAVATGTILSAAPATPAAANNCWHYHRSERSFATKVNHARATRGISRPQRDKTLAVVARRAALPRARL